MYLERTNRAVDKFVILPPGISVFGPSGKRANRVRSVAGLAAAQGFVASNDTVRNTHNSGKDARSVVG